MRMRYTTAAVAMRALCAFFIGAATFYALSALCAIVNFAWRQPMFDQWRLYKTYLTLPFPQNAVQLENGHRPIFPNLLRIAEIHWFAANQLLQISVGTLFALITFFAIAMPAAREARMPAVVRCAGVMLAAFGVFWLANARMLLHGNESVHVYLVTLAVCGGSLLIFHAGRRQSLAFVAAASLACAIAMFSFGPGVASFAAITLIGSIMRLPWRWLLVPIATLAICLSLYLFALPGNDGVREVLHAEPVESARIMAQWLSAPWVYAWLGLPDPPGPLFVDETYHVVRPLRFTASLLGFTGLSWRTWSTLIGCAGIIGFCVRVALFLRRGPSEFMRWQAVAAGIGVFAMAGAAIFSVGRLDYLRLYPNQVYADRYLVWPSLFWCACAMLLLIDLAHSRSRLLRYGGLAILFAMPFALAATQSGGAVWGSMVFRQSQQAAAAARSDVVDASVLPDGPAVQRAAVPGTLALLKQGRLAMFADPNWERVGTQVGELKTNPGAVVEARISRVFDDAQTHKTAARVEGVAFADGQLAIVDEDNRIVGLAEFSHISPDAPALRLDLPHKFGFDGYIREYEAGRHYRLILLARNGEAYVLKNL